MSNKLSHSCVAHDTTVLSVSLISINHLTAAIGGHLLTATKQGEVLTAALREALRAVGPSAHHTEYTVVDYWGAIHTTCPGLSLCREQVLLILSKL